MEVIDIVTYNNESWLLDLRIKILEDVVDWFYVIEATQTHQGASKPCLRDTQEFSHPKLRVVTINFPDSLDNWGRERSQRAHKIDLSEHNENALVLTGDLDEIPDPKAISWLQDNYEKGQIYQFGQRLFQYYLNNENLTEQWYGTRACDVDSYYYYNGERLRWTDGLRLEKAGWHFSFLGGVEVLKKKITEYAHAEFNNEQTLSSIEERMARNQDIFERGIELKTVKIDNSFPDYVVNNQDALKDWIKNV